MDRIYLDYAATAPLLPEAREAMLPWLQESYGNPSSLHAEGRAARCAIDVARETTSDAMGCDFGEVTFTSSGTEAANLAILGLALADRDASRRRVLMSAVEHDCVLSTKPLLERLGFSVQLISVDSHAVVNIAELEESLGSDVLLVAVMHANNELGTIQPVQEIAELTKKAGALFFCDAVQTFVTLPGKVQDMGADLVAVSAHKIGGPKGAGALYTRGGLKLQPLAVGGGQEREMRAGTENVAAIAGFGVAIQRSLGDAGRSSRMKEARNSFVESVNRFVAPENNRPAPSWTLPDSISPLPGHAHVRFPGLSAESILIVLDRMGVSASSGAACSSGSLEPSHVLKACGYSDEESREGLRFTFGPSISAVRAVEAGTRVAAAAEQVCRARAR